MKIDSEVLRERLNNQKLIDWIDKDKSSKQYKRGYLSGLIKALSVLGEVEYFTEHGKDREPIKFEISEDTANELREVIGAVNDKIKELELESHSEKDIVNMCIGLMEDVHEKMMEYMEMMDVEHTEGIPTLRYSYFEIVQKLLLYRTKHSGGTSTRDKCKQLGLDSYKEIFIGKSEAN